MVPFRCAMCDSIVILASFIVYSAVSLDILSHVLKMVNKMEKVEAMLKLTCQLSWCRMRSGMEQCQEDQLLDSLRNRNMKSMRSFTTSCQVHQLILFDYLRNSFCIAHKAAQSSPCSATDQ